MSDVLLIDGNPDHVRPLSGLFKYRIKHSLDVAGDCVSGLRRIYARPPEVILINALLFASEDYGFARALSEEPAHASIRVVVLISGRLEEIRARAAGQYGATILELPASAGELSKAIETASRLRSQSANPQTVTWGSVEPVRTQDRAAEEKEKPSVQPVSWQPLDQSKETDTNGVRQVNWAIDGGEGQNVKGRGSRKPKPGRPTPSRAETREPQGSKRISRKDAKDFRPAVFSRGDGFRPISSAVEKVEIPEEETGPQPFRPSNPKGLSDVDPRSVKNR